MDREKYNAYMRAYLPERQRKMREWALDIFGNKCARCGNTEGPFEFDHIDPKLKAIEIGDLWKYSKEKQQEELAKCQLLCGPCHREKTCEDNGWKYSVREHGLPSSHRHCKCRICLDAWTEYQHKRSEILGKKTYVRQEKKTEITHGTRAGYLKERRLGMETCIDCKRANTEYTKQLNAKLAGQAKR